MFPKWHRDAITNLKTASHGSYTREAINCVGEARGITLFLYAMELTGLILHPAVRDRNALCTDWCFCYATFVLVPYINEIICTFAAE